MARAKKRILMTSATAVLAIFLGLTAGSEIRAQGGALSSSSGPAELPPSSFQGRRFVDSRGCVFIRAGVAGATQWVPQVSRDRNLVCGQTPTNFAGGATRPAPTPAVPIPVQSQPSTTTVTASANQRVVRQGTASAAAAAVAAVRAAPRQVRVDDLRVQRPASSSFARIAPVQPTFFPGVGLSNTRIPVELEPMNDGRARVVHGVRDSNPVGRWGEIRRVEYTSSGASTAASAPTGGQIVANIYGDSLPGQTTATSVENGRVIVHGVRDNNPVGRWGEISRTQYSGAATHGNNGSGYYAQNAQHAANVALSSRNGTAVIPGYRPAWDDGRLNPNRGLVTDTGVVQSQRYWTRTIPRVSIVNGQRVIYVK